jgi:uncharacterized protein involved in cysteine biosynthesis
MKKVSWGKICYSVMIVLFLCSSVLEAIEPAKRRRAGKRGKKTVSEEHSWTGIYYCLAILALTVIPTLAVFIYSLYNDPMTPTIISQIGEVVKERTIGYLSRKKEA